MPWVSMEQIQYKTTRIFSNNSIINVLILNQCPFDLLQVLFLHEMVLMALYIAGISSGNGGTSIEETFDLKVGLG